jgi:Xaa-Pro aminopeptidase
MFQDFSNSADPAVGAQRTRQLASLLDGLGVDAVVVPRSDEHMGEYVPAAAERLRWLTGFSGSAGMAVVGRRFAALFVDGRYTLQAATEVDPKLFEILQSPETDAVAWTVARLGEGGVLGYDPWLHTTAWVRAAEAKAKKKGARLKPLSRNPVDRLWGRERPASPLGPVIVHPMAYAGRSAADKIADLQKVLKSAGEEAAVLTLPDSIAWLFNIRGSDVKHNPTALAFAILHQGQRPELFIDRRKLGPEAKRHLAEVARVREPSELRERLVQLRTAGKKVRLDESTAAHWFRRVLGERSTLVVDGRDPCILPKARKNSVELAGARAAHERDGVAMARFLAWLDRNAPSGRVDEIGAVRQLEAFRAETEALREISFDTISGSGPHGAIVHYRVSEATNRRIKPGELFLVDSGAQYQDGTTDVTRTIAVGRPTQEMRERFTLVLKGHIAIATLRFPAGTLGVHIDAFARAALWKAGLDFDHGTGHGVGSYLSVHEGPQSISKRGHAALEPGMIVSNEPGYYKAGAYGIRIENLEVVTEAEAIPGGERPMLGFETLTLVPIDRRLVNPGLLSADELRWLNDYHARVRRTIGRHLVGDDLDWLEQATAAIA